METVTLNRLGSQKKLKINGYSCEIGTVNSVDGKCFYINLGGWVLPTTDLNDDLKPFRHYLRKFVDGATTQLLGNVLDRNKPILRVLDVATSNMTKVNNKFTYFSIELTVYMNEKKSIKDMEFLDSCMLILYSLTDLLDEYREVTFKPSKK